MISARDGTLLSMAAAGAKLGRGAEGGSFCNTSFVADSLPACGKSEFDGGAVCSLSGAGTASPASTIAVLSRGTDDATVATGGSGDGDFDFDLDFGLSRTTGSSKALLTLSSSSSSCSARSINVSA